MAKPLIFILCFDFENRTAVSIHVLKITLISTLTLIKCRNLFMQMSPGFHIDGNHAGL